MIDDIHGDLSDVTSQPLHQSLDTSDMIDDIHGDLTDVTSQPLHQRPDSFPATLLSQPASH